MLSFKTSQLLIALLIANPLLVSGAFSFSQSIALLARKPILVKTSPSEPSISIKMGREGAPAASTNQDLELTRQLIMAHFDAVDKVSGTSAFLAEESPRASTASLIVLVNNKPMEISTSPSLAEDAAHIPDSVEKDIASSIKANRKNAGYVKPKGINIFRHLSRGLGFGSRRLTTALGFRNHGTN